LFWEIDEGGCLVVSPDGRIAAGEGEFCFVELEDLPAKPWTEMEKVVLYSWNRPYPADRKFPFDIFRDAAWELSSAVEFPGKSHEKITEYVFERVL